MGEQKFQRLISTATRSTPTSSQSTSVLTTLLQQTSLGGKMNSGAAILRGTTTALRALHPSSFLVLFTPVVPPSSPSADPTTDPFEPLGRALGAQHSRVRHVPYVPSAGMTETHLAFLRHAGAVVVVVVSDIPVKGGETSALTSYDFQCAFARSVTGHAGDYKELSDVPIVLLLVSGDGPQRMKDFANFDCVVWSQGYGAEALRQVAGVMVG